MNATATDHTRSAGSLDRSTGLNTDHYPDHSADRNAGRSVLGFARSWPWSHLEMLAVVLMSAVGLAVRSPALIVGPWLASTAHRHWQRGARAERSRRQVIESLPPFVDAVIQRLKAGGSLAQAFQATEGSPALERYLTPFRVELSSGLSLGMALRRLQASLERSADQPPGLTLVVNAVAVLVERGGQALPSLERLNDTLRSAQWIESEIRTQAGQAMASAAMLAALPAVFVVGLTVADERLARFYLFSIPGSVCLATAAIGSYSGLWWMRRIIRGVV